MSLRRILPLAALAVAVAVAAPSLAGAKSTVGRAVPASQRVSMDRVDHAPWTALLKKHVDDRGRVNYRAWKASAADRAALGGYLASLSRADADIQSSRAARLAFWINAYNAVTIEGILREYPTSSIRNHTAKLFGYNIWHDLLLIVGDQRISLNDIEHEVLRKMDEPRIHFAIVCASHSCPRLLNEAYEPSKLTQQLAANTRNFFANRENFRYRDGTFHLSSILKWFAEDFGSSSAEVLMTIAPFLPDAEARRAAAAGRGRIAYLDYDWSINEQPTGVR